MIRLVQTISDNKDFQDLVSLLDQGLLVTDGHEFSFFAQYNKTDRIKNVIVAYFNDIPVGCGAFKEFAPRTVEIKRMFVKEEFRGKGISKTILKALETWAKELEYEQAVLETGIMLDAAIQLYKKAGYEVTPNYAQYIGVESSVCMKKTL